MTFPCRRPQKKSDSRVTGKQLNELEKNLNASPRACPLYKLLVVVRDELLKAA